MRDPIQLVPPTPTCRLASTAALFILVAYSLVRFRGALLTFFFLDDFWVMRDAARVDVESVWDLSQLFQLGHVGFLMYRPLSTTIYAYVQHALFGYDSSGYHALQLLVFAANVGLVFAIARRLAGSTRAAFAVGLLYLLAPGQAVDAYWLSAFTVTGTVFWLLLMMWAWLALTSVWRVLACTLLQVIGLLASEHAVVAPVLCGILAAMQGLPWRRSVAAVGPAATVVAGYLLAKVWYFVEVRSIVRIYAVTPDVRIWLRHLGQYALSCFNVSTLWGPGELAYFGIGLGLLAVGLRATWRSYAGRDEWRLLACGLALFATSLAPVLVLKTHHKDHYICLAALGAALAVIGCCRLLTRHWRWFGVAVAVALLVVDVATGERAWRENQILRLVVGGSMSAAAWVETVQEAARSDAVQEVLVPMNAVTGSLFRSGHVYSYFPAMPRSVLTYDPARAPKAGAGQVVLERPNPSPLSRQPFGPRQRLPGWDPRWDWLRRLAGET